MGHRYEVTNNSDWVDIVYNGEADVETFMDIADVLFHDDAYKDKASIWHFRNPESMLCLEDTARLLKNIRYMRPSGRKRQKAALVLGSSAFVISAAEFATENNTDIEAELRIFANYEDAREWIRSTLPFSR